MAYKIEDRLDDDTLREIISLYAQGYSLKEIGKQFGIYRGTVRNMLIRLGLHRKGGKGNIYKRVCKKCHKFFIASSPKQIYCHAPCEYKNKRSDTGMRYIYISSIRKAFWERLKSNPKNALKLQEQMKKEEGPEFTNMVLDGITETKKFKHLEKIQKKYKKVFE